MAHQQRAEDVGAAGDLVVHDALVLHQAVIIAAQLVERGDGAIARAVGVVHGRPVDGLFALPYRQVVGNGERLAVPHHHAGDAACFEQRVGESHVQGTANFHIEGTVGVERRRAA